MRRFIGLILIATGIFGLAISAVGLLAAWQGVAIAGAAVERELAALDKALQTTDDGLSVADGSLADARASLASLAATIGGATQTITDTLPVLDSLGGLAGDELPQTVRSTQTALRSAQETAQVVDSVLGAISSFGLLSSATYNPKVPLSDSIGQVSQSLDTLPASLRDVSTGVVTARRNLSELNKDLGLVATGIDGVRLNLDDAAAVVRQYRGIVGDLRAQVAEIRAAAPGWIDLAGVGLGLLLIWLALAQLAIFSQGFEMMRRT